METSKKVDSILFLQSPFKATDNICITLPEGAESCIKRVDNRALISINEDNYVNAKYKWVNLSYPITQKIWKCNGIVHLNNDKDLEKGLIKILNKCNFWDDEVRILTTLWMNRLQELESPYFKCEIYFDEKCDKFFPLTLDKEPSYRNRAMVKFIPVEKKGKDVIDPREFVARTGDLRLVEFIGYIDQDKGGA